MSILQSISNMDIHYKADIKGSISVWHLSAVDVISGKSIAGNNLKLTGGNFIESCRPMNFSKIEIADNFYVQIQLFLVH